MDELTVSIEQIKKIIQKSEEVGAEVVTFSFIIGSLFPTAYEAIKQKLIEERIAGFNEAMEKVKKQVEELLQ